jgi:GTP pyrophosphokinase
MPFLIELMVLGACLYNSGMVAVALTSPQSEALNSALLAQAERYATPRTREIKDVLAGLRLDSETLAAGLLLDVRPEEMAKCTLDAQHSDAIHALVQGVHRMALIHDVPQGKRTAAEQAQQLEGLRKMLLAMVEDVRVVIIKLAERLVTLREVAAGTPDAVGRHAAEEVRDLFAPLANRLGVWQLKWELEDQSLRVLEPTIYKQIAKALDERKLDRDDYIVRVKTMLYAELKVVGIEADIAGRAKHITSIWNKMRRKGYGIDGLYDIRAVRVLVDEVRDCYAVLGIVHNLWTPIPSEFDDYIARPKSNNYRSLHTAVVGPDGRALEVQIRTHSMHQASEFGIAAHWRYKEGGFSGGGKRDVDFEDKLAWLRQVMDWRDQVDGSGEVIEALKTSLFEDSIFVFTPQGKVIDLPKDATPIDFAYHVHTNLGHRCRGARVDGAMVPLNLPLKNGQRVEVSTVKEGGPSRDWLNPELGYVRSPRAKSKVRAWFNVLAQDETQAQGRAELERVLQREGKTALSLEMIVRASEYTSLDELFTAIARARVNQRELVELVHRAAGDKVEEAPKDEAVIRRARSGGDSGILIVGLDKLMTGLARCCRPAPPDAIIGFVTRGKGISVHRQSCSNVTRMQNVQPERLIEAQWGGTQDGVFPVVIDVIAVDRQGLLRDISEALSKERINVTAVNTLSKDLQAKMRFTAEIRDIAQLRKALTAVTDVKGVLEARRG